MKQQDITIEEITPNKFNVAWKIWDSAKFLIDYVRENFDSEEFRERLNLKPKARILDLGSGTGVAGLAFCEFQPELIMLTDVQEYLPMIQKNIDKNSQHFREGTTVKCEELRWGTENLEQLKLLIEKYKGGFDLVVGSDIIYYDDSIPLLFETLEVLASYNRNVKVVLSYQPRGFFSSFFVQQYSDTWDFDTLFHKDSPDESKWNDINILLVQKKMRK